MNRAARGVGELRAVLFDMDGTLVETEQYWGEAMFELAASLGGRMSERARAATVGSTMRRSMSILHADLGLARTEEQLLADARWVEDRTAQLLGSGISWCPGARELLIAVRAAGLRSALVTTTPRRLADIVLTTIRADLGGDPFDVTICGDEVPARKPDPAPYLQAMAALGVEPAGCVVVEDSQSGVAAGLAAGAAVLGVPTVQEIPSAPGLTVRNGLGGVDVAGLADVLARGDMADASA
ncbi:HAD superfamily hydrolase (TIGR01509 family)/HAD superfamily hydrolase (TIGR01549 family) [Blastococcus colisei]|uniref:HAD superfamily hydrolase (TIGR01509 family)/HAD superfamily hydrolase (TIGR01549 family) n=1 Tax=Blastococcus colisei TaxID=1564162 RepID=A0A543PFX8_9ACTN|nr:HAD family phosphatase [Blastococcus colisei]TQN42977.1 HAD superfamily hydrolase (TIGR01509 family)/HAD superfamily hydrolase (TIGR01549 family) [Blastococcus colisei]